MVGRARCLTFGVPFGALTIVLLIYSAVELYKYSGPQNNNVNYRTNLCGIPDSWFNGSLPTRDYVQGPFPFGPQFRCPYQGVVGNQQPMVSPNMTNPFIYRTSTQFLAFINLTYFTNPVPDNVTAAVTTQIPLTIRQALPGSSVTVANFSSAFTGQGNGFYITITNTQLTNVTTFDLLYILMPALQSDSVRFFWGLPVELLSWNQTVSVNVPFPTTTCGARNDTCSSDGRRTCANWMGDPICVCRWPDLVRYPGGRNCVPNPCWSADARTANGGCARVCTPNFQATNNVTCS